MLGVALPNTLVGPLLYIQTRERGMEGGREREGGREGGRGREREGGREGEGGREIWGVEWV